MKIYLENFRKMQNFHEIFIFAHCVAKIKNYYNKDYSGGSGAEPPETRNILNSIVKFENFINLQQVGENVSQICSKTKE